MPRSTGLQKREARRMYEQDGESFAAIGRHFGFKGMTVSKWAKAEGWVKAGSTPNPFDPPASASAGSDAAYEQIATESGQEPPPAATESGRSFDEQELREQIRRLEARNAQLAEDNERLSPTRDIGEYLEDRVDWLTANSPEGEAYWLNRAEAKFKTDNRQRAKDGLPPFDIKQHPEILDDLIIELQTAERMSADKETTEPPARRVKLWIMRNGMPTIEQIPMENQINNMAGSLADGIVRYTRKGFKLTDPFLCPHAGCFRPAAVDELNRWAYDGYCTERHRAAVEGGESSPTVGLNTKDTILSGIR